MRNDRRSGRRMRRLHPDGDAADRRQQRAPAIPASRRSPARCCSDGRRRRRGRNADRLGARRPGDTTAMVARARRAGDRRLVRRHHAGRRIGPVARRHPCGRTHDRTGRTDVVRLGACRVDRRRDRIDHPQPARRSAPDPVGPGECDDRQHLATALDRPGHRMERHPDTLGGDRCGGTGLCRLGIKGSPQMSVKQRLVEGLRVLTVAGIPTGVLVAGVGSRLAMLLLRLTSDESVNGLESDDGFTIGEVTLSGTYNLLMLGATVGVIGAGAYRMVRPWLIGPNWLRRVTVALGAGAVVGSMLIHADGVDFRALTPTWLAIGLFVALPATFALAVAVAVDR